MNKNRIVLIALLAVIAGGFVATFLTSRSQSQNTDHQQKTDNYVPIVDLYAPAPNDPGLVEIQNIRGRKYNNGNLTEDIPDQVSEILDLPLSHAQPEPALPTTQSDLIVIGEVTESQAVLSTDRTNVYSEFTICIEELIKNKSPLKLTKDTTIVAERAGGVVRFPNGNLQRLGVSGKDLPVKNQRYVFFLKWGDSDKDFRILTGYKIQNGKVLPLDGNGNSRELSVYKNYQNFKDKNSEDFINLVKKANSAPSEVPK